MVKVISLSNEAYEKLSRAKSNRSFSQTVLRLLDSKHNTQDITRFFGKWPGDKTELNKIENVINKDRKKFKLREVKL